jgi:asparagine synthase (glutamine-hydrolysing)
MCGICGILHADPERPVDPAVVRGMTESIIHRGPDDDGYFVEGPVGLGMRRLSIIDLASGQQPIANEDGTVRLIDNGEIYNYAELRGELGATGHRFRTRSDTEVLVHAYEEDGADFVSRLRGMFALALWDASQRRLLLAVDRFGIKPLYYAVSGTGIAFGSELKCVIRSGLSTREIDFGALGQYFTLGYIPPPATIFAGVSKLAPGTLLQWTPASGTAVHRYWDSPRHQVDRHQNPAETRSGLRAALVDAVRSHLVSDVPVGAFLSGGIDSSAVVALMSEASDEPVRTFSIGFADSRYSELDKARVVARRYGTDHHELMVEPESLDELLPRLAAHFDEPFADSSALPTYHVSKLAREHVKVVLSGDGGDELFIGYTLFRGLKLAQHAQSLPAPVRRMLSALPERMPRIGRGASGDRLELLLRRIGDSMRRPEDAFKRKLSAPGLDVVRPLLSPGLRQSLDEHDPFELVDRWLGAYGPTNGAHPLESFVNTGFQVSLAGDMLVKVDRMSMANSLEVRVPLLDHVLAEHVAAIPIDRRMPRWRLKGLLRDTLADELPPEILRQPKRGFVVPLTTWFRDDLARYARETLLSPEALGRGFLKPSATAAMLARHEAGQGNEGSLIWTLLMFELWCREALDGGL